MKSNYKVLTGSHAIEVDPPTQCVGNDGLHSQLRTLLLLPASPKLGLSLCNHECISPKSENAILEKLKSL